MLIGACRRSYSRSTRSRAGDGSLCAITAWRPTSSSVTRCRAASGCSGWREQHELVAPSGIDCRPCSAGWNVSTPKSRLPVEQFGRNLPRRDAPDVDHRLRVLRVEAFDERQQRVDGGFVGADDDPPAPDLLELANRRFGVGGEPHQPLRVVLQQPAGLGERAVSGRSIEQALAQLLLQPADALADRRLGPVELRGGAEKLRSAATVRKTCQILELHDSRMPCIITYHNIEL